MRELFRYYRVDLLEQQRLAMAQQILAEHLQARIAITGRQLFNELKDLHVLESDYSLSRWHDLLNIGLYGGFLDWDLTPDCEVQPITIGGKLNKELWLRSAFCLNNWVRDTFTAKCRVRTSDGQRWQSQQLYNAAHLPTELLTQGQHFTVYYASDPHAEHSGLFRKTNQILSNMVKVKLARQMYNAETGLELWQFEGMRRLGSRRSSLRNRANHHLQCATKTVELLLHFVDLGTGTRSLVDRSPMELRVLSQVVLE